MTKFMQNHSKFPFLERFFLFLIFCKSKMQEEHFILLPHILFIY